ncbi:dienelactone hydrolase family protein [Ottowia thiooxydans]|uniref:dienelactone hydrolase family protein n=1 Tax=Ottowia thiooxydans TaxID=219182 RepID=UPI0003F81A4F|nr:dienelactone hydrolase family protein [Ottowia thiooxydans]
MTQSRNVTINTAAGAFAGYLAKPAAEASSRPAVLLLPEIYNLNDWIKAVADQYAAHGYLTLVPDLFWRQEAAAALPYTPEGQQRGRALGAGLSREDAVVDVLASVEWLRQQGAVAVGAVGFCLGGELALLAAAESPRERAPVLDSAVAYYPTRMEHHLEAVARIAAPSLIHIGEKDYRTPPDMVTSLSSVLPATSELYVYPDADHGFGRFGHPPFHAPSAELALTRTYTWLDSRTAR